jgi:hypothetical protein
VVSEWYEDEDLRAIWHDMREDGLLMDDDPVADTWERDQDDLEEEDWEEHFGGPEDVDEDSTVLDEDEDEDEDLEQTEEVDDETVDDDVHDDHGSPEAVDDLAVRCIHLQRKLESLAEELREAKDALAQMLADGEVIEANGHQLVAGLGRRYAYSGEVRRLARALRDLRRAEVEDGRAQLLSAYPQVQIRRQKSDLLAEFPNYGKKWLESDVSVFDELMEFGWSFREIANHLGRPPGALRIKWQQLHSWEPVPGMGELVRPPREKSSDDEFVGADDDDIPF